MCPDRLLGSCLLDYPSSSVLAELCSNQLLFEVLFLACLPCGGPLFSSLIFLDLSALVIIASLDYLQVP